MEIERHVRCHDVSQLKARGASDAAHQAATLGTGGERIVRSARLGLAVRRWRRAVVGLPIRMGFEQSPNTREIEAALALGEETVVADAMKAVRQDVHEEASDELMRGKAHDAERPPRR